MSDPRQEYTNFHRRMRQDRGPASDQTCVDCDKPAAHWTLKAEHHVPGELVFIVGDYTAYEPRCAGCHVRADREGYVVSGETREKMRVAQTGSTHTPETRGKISSSLKGREKTAEHREALSKAQTGKKASEETKAKLSAVHRGVPKSAAHREAISKALKNRYTKEQNNG